MRELKVEGLGSIYIMDHISLIQSSGRVDRTINNNKLRKNKIKRICQN